MVTLLLLISNVPVCPLHDYGLCVCKWPCVTVIGGITSLGGGNKFPTAFSCPDILFHLLKMLAYNLFTPVFVLYMQSWSNLETQSEISMSHMLTLVTSTDFIVLQYLEYSSF